MPTFEPHPDYRPVLVSGASSGIGASTARTLAAAGHPVALGARRIAACEEVAESIRAEGGQALAHKLDVGDAASVREFVDAAQEAHGPTEILVSGAGDLDAALIHELDPEDFAHHLNVHLVGTHRLVSAVVPGMVRRGRGDVVVIGSDVVPSPRPRVGSYVPAKSGVEAMARTMQMELEGTGVRASIVRPGPTQTAMGMDFGEEKAGPLLEDWMHWGFARHPYFLRPSDIAAAVSTVVSVPRGAHVALMEVQPEAPLTKEAHDAS
ncbi:SDR family oxidoreductase [Haloechinothrix sp. YIM 98757]|uniref:SDR family oxidoreductase n=1 Tax=Haloechinothrix aidingensis TaxID=2752311 RepID=A0A838ACD9_9PSEU|nr:SDR family oxidoreductase [Haloechinothrix aidingensis]MBA0126924.1 SDR family oxidoreductase [Haloechinothrix aidingensis]